MKLRKISEVLIVILLVLVSCTKERPEIDFEEKTIDLGIVKADTVINVFFKPINIGKNNLKIERVTSDCHCTVARDYQKNIEPNQKGEIKVTYHSKGFGYFEQLIEVFSNAENSPSLLIIKGRVDFPKEE